MSVSVESIVQTLDHSREYFLKHLAGLTDDQWQWKPYGECKSIRETISHLIIDDRCALESIRTGAEPNYDAHDNLYEIQDPSRLIALLQESHEELKAEILSRYRDKPIDAEICSWGSMMPMCLGVTHMSSEDYYHAGQVAFIRMATDPGWNYYSAIYGME